MILDLAHVVLMAITTLMFVLIQIERYRATRREEKLLDRLMAENLADFNNTPENHLKIMKAESALAESAYKLESLNQPKESGYPVN